MLLEAAFPETIMTAEARDYNWHLAKAKVALCHLQLGNAQSAYDMLALTREFYPDWGAESSPKIPKLYQAVRDKLPDEFKEKLAALEKAAEKKVEEQAQPEEAAPAAGQ